MTVLHWLALFVVMGVLSGCGPWGGAAFVLLLLIVALYLAAPLLSTIAQAVHG